MKKTRNKKAEFDAVRELIATAPTASIKRFWEAALKKLEESPPEKPKKIRSRDT